MFEPKPHYYTTLAVGLYATPALAAGEAFGPTTLGGLAIGLIGTAAALKCWFASKKLSGVVAQLGEQLAQHERTILQLQGIRAQNERTIEQKTTALAESQLQRSQSQEMLQTLRTQVERVARIDGLTGIANRQQMAETLEDEIKRTVRQRKPLSLLYADLDFFSDYREINGSEKADHTLQKVATTISETFRRAGDLVARVGDASFAVILPEAGNETSEKFAEKLRRSVYQLCIPYPGSDAADRITVSVGIVTVPPTRLHERDYVIAMAQNALLHAQSKGHNRVSMSANAA